MKREIKFRVYNGLEMIDNVTVGKFGYFYVNPEKGDGLNPEDTASLTGNTSKYEGAPLMQFTGLTDKNGIEIYEGDMLQYMEHERYLMESCKMLICWDDEMAGFGYKMDSLHDFFRSFWNHDGLKEDVLNHCVVIGNIYENPELLNK